MKKTTKTILCLTGWFALSNTQAQTVSTFEETTLAPNSYYDGSNYNWGFNSGNAHYYNYYDTTFGASFGYWAAGWAVSNIYDTITQPSSYGQLYNAKEVAPTSSLNFAIGTQGSRIVLTGAASGKVVNGFHITNSTYAFNSMKLGDSFGKKFGGVSGNDPDYFKIVIKKYLGGVMGTDSVEFYLADFRDALNTNDYIIENWTWVDLTTLGNVDSLEFTLRSSDVGSFGINTPLYYCIDNFTTANSFVGITEDTFDNTFSVYPNPCTNTINVQSTTPNSSVVLSDINGKTLMNNHFDHSIQLNVAELPSGMYFVKVNGITKKILK